MNLGDYYLLDSQYTGYKITALATPFASLGFTTRFVSQHGTMKVTGFLPHLPGLQFGQHQELYDRRDHPIWTPCTQCYLQLDANFGL